MRGFEYPCWRGEAAAGFRDAGALERREYLTQQNIYLLAGRCEASSLLEANFDAAGNYGDAAGAGLRALS